jgi:hypothetical protein
MLSARTSCVQIRLNIFEVSRRQRMPLSVVYQALKYNLNGVGGFSRIASKNVSRQKRWPSKKKDMG